MNQIEDKQKESQPGKDFFILEYIVLTLFNAIIIGNAFSKGGWAALGLLAIVSPILNGIFFVISIVKAPTLSNRRVAGGEGFALLAILLPLIMIVISFAILFSGVIGWNGC